jgi:hypothetical protein
VLTAEVSYAPCPDALEESASRTEGGWSLCAFRGLSAEREYVFWVFTEKGVVTVSYAAGKFRGYGFYTRL